MEKPFQTTTLLALAPSEAFALFEEKGRNLDVPVERDADRRLTLTTARGDVQLTASPEGVQITLRSHDRALLHTLQETIDGNLDVFGLKDERIWSLKDVGTRPANIAFAAVTACARLSPSYFRVELADPALRRFSETGLHFRLLFPPADHEGQWPEIGENGRTEWPGGVAAWHRPVYTIRSVEPDSGTVVFDVFIHEGGRVSAWCETLRPGMSVALMGPGGEWYPKAGWLALFGDETALPAIARILAACPDDTRGSATIMVGRKGDLQELEKPPGVTLNWLLRDSGTSLLEPLESLALPETDRFVWFAGERSEVKVARTILSGKGLSKSEMRAASYWTADTLSE
ncbi:siderophore-interacting protein [Pseudohoeflea suaedae]|uniref:Siderophore-interacting protein n=1 Tax=Pseudohoeflea suaedae TaxID=877384 RepID=A0A4R5PNG9_9HYPH|nr:siderophore-interacting protein [Pseudohoeflea suaedae]TDH38438.1 siderophore-interacting protein [Pseudohoeflea suaedae]